LIKHHAFAIANEINFQKTSITSSNYSNSSKY